MAEKYLVRIPPSSPRLSHTCHGRTYRRDKGWYGPVSKELAELLKKEPLNELAEPGTSASVFEVIPESQAADVAHRESQRRDPVGTHDRPHRVEEDEEIERGALPDGPPPPPPPPRSPVTPLRDRDRQGQGQARQGQKAPLPRGR